MPKVVEPEAIRDLGPLQREGKRGADLTPGAMVALLEQESSPPRRLGLERHQHLVSGTMLVRLVAFG